jgi:hypothetical protein
MFRYTLLTVAAYEAVSGCVALFVLLDIAVRGGASVGGLLIALPLAVLLVVSGVLLTRKPPRWLWLASSLQLAQVLYVFTPWIQYVFVMGIDAGAALVVRTGPVWYAGVTFRAYPMAMFSLFFGRPSDAIVVGVNVVALGMWLAIRQARKTMHANLELTGAAPPSTSGVPG